MSLCDGESIEHTSKPKAGGVETEETGVLKDGGEWGQAVTA